MIVALGSLVVLAVAFGVREWAAYREREDHIAQQSLWAYERRELLNRIKPETAQYQPPEDVQLPPEPEPEPYFHEDGTPYGEGAKDPFGVLNGGS